jgi:carbamoyltransferase
MQYILGINAFHPNSSACILRNGEVIFAIEEERINRIKNWCGFPEQAIRKCLDYAKININEVLLIAINKNFKSNIMQKLLFGIKNKNNFNYSIKKIGLTTKRKKLEDIFIEKFNLKYLKPKIIYVDHHTAHLASSYLTSQFKESALLSLDGFGDFVSCAIGFAKNNRFEITKRIYYPHSLGILYQSVTQFLGFTNFGDEYKVMGLAALGKPFFFTKMKNLISYDKNNYKLNEKYFSYFRTGLNFNFKNGTPNFLKLYNKNFYTIFGKARKYNEKLNQVHADIASSLQITFEKILINILNYTYKEFDIKNLSYSGGCAMNSVANGKIQEQTMFKNLFIHPAAYDAGGCIGAAAYVHFKNYRQKIILRTNYLGPSYTNKQILTSINNLNIKKKFIVNFIKEEDKLIKFITKLLIDKKIIGLFKGRLEWGARALGNRSIIADPRGRKIKNIINKKIKLRELFRPFAPSILFQQTSKWFDVKKNVSIPSMMKVLKYRNINKNLIPAVTHFDNTGRLQTVKYKNNKFYYKLIKNFFFKTKIPILLNTSFNINEPIVCSPEDALKCFLKSKMDSLIIENYVIKRGK